MEVKDSTPDINRPFKNINCAYCGVELDATSSTKEHVIGKHFVPKGKLDGQWNLILNVCRYCNNLKSDLEDDLSAISMQPDGYGQHAVNDLILFDQARRKAIGSKSRLTNKPVGDSKEKIEINSTLTPGVHLKLSMSSPPQADPARIYHLAEFHLKAFFYLVTYNQKTKRGGFWPGAFFPILFSKRADWGNSVQVAFMHAINDWQFRVRGIAADSFFKIIIRRHPDAECWGWALEWNQSHRIIGFFGDPESIRSLLDTFPALEFFDLPTSNSKNYVYRLREEIPLNESADLLFK